MKKRKIRYKIWLLLATVLAVAFLASCGKREDDVIRLSLVDLQNEKTEDSGLPKLKIGCTIVEPYFYVGEDGNYTGIDEEIAEEACRRLGYEPVFTKLTWGEQDSLLNDGTVDCMWSCFAMDGREMQYQWAGPYLYSQEVVVVAADSEIQTLSDLAGKDIAVRVASRAEDYFMKQATPNVPDVGRILTYNNMEDAFTAFGKGYTDAVAEHKMALKTFTDEHSELYRYLEPSFRSTKIGVAFSRDYDSEFVEKLEETLNEMNQDGTIPAIAARYGLEEEDLVREGTDAK